MSWSHLRDTIFKPDPQAENKRKLEWARIYLAKAKKNIVEVSEDRGLSHEYPDSLIKALKYIMSDLEKSLTKKE